jgi:hypothetical protein
VDYAHATTAHDVGAAAVLVRPDGYVCWASEPGAPTQGLTEVLTRWFG